jgi:hypothetical protein
MYIIIIDNGVFSVRRQRSACRSARQYFGAAGKPERIRVLGWPFSSIYLTNGTDSNGTAVAW